MSDKELLKRCSIVSSDCIVETQGSSIECSPSEGLSTPPISNLKSEGDDCLDIVEKTPERVPKKNRRHHLRSFSLQNVTSPFLTKKRMKIIEKSKILNSFEGGENVSSFTPDKIQLRNVGDNNISPESTEGARVSAIVDPLKNVEKKGKKSIVKDKDFNHKSCPNLKMSSKKDGSEPINCSSKILNENNALMTTYSCENILSEPEKCSTSKSNNLCGSDLQDISKVNLNRRKLIYSTSSKLNVQPVVNILPENLLKDVLTLEQADTPCISGNINTDKFNSISGNFVSVNKICILDDAENLNADSVCKLSESQNSTAFEETLIGYDFKLTQLENNYCLDTELHKTEMIENGKEKSTSVAKAVVCHPVIDSEHRAIKDHLKSHPILTEGVECSEIFNASSSVSNLQSNGINSIGPNKSELISGLFKESSKITDLKTSPKLKRTLGNQKTGNCLKKSLNNSQSSYTNIKRSRNKCLSRNYIELPEQSSLNETKTKEGKCFISASNTELKSNTKIKECGDALSRDFLGFLNIDVNQSQDVFSKFINVFKNKGLFPESDFVEFSKERKLVNPNFHISSNISSKSFSCDNDKNFNNHLSKIGEEPGAFIHTDFYDKLIKTSNPEGRLEASKSEKFNSSVSNSSFPNSNLKETLITTDDVGKVDLKSETSGSKFDDSFPSYDMKLTQIELYNREKISSKVNSPFNLTKKRKLSLKSGRSNSSQSSLGDATSNSDFCSPVSTSTKKLINQTENDLKLQNTENISLKKSDHDLPSEKFISNTSCPNNNRKMQNETFKRSDSIESLTVSEKPKSPFADEENLKINVTKMSYKLLEPDENLIEISNNSQSSEKIFENLPQEDNRTSDHNKTVFTLPEQKRKDVSNEHFAAPSPLKKNVQLLGFTSEEMEVSEISVRSFYSFLKKLMVNDNCLIKNIITDKNINSENSLLDKTLDCESFLDSDGIMENDNSIFNFSFMADEISESQDLFSEPKTNQQITYSFIESEETTSPPLVTLSQKMKSIFDSFQGTCSVKSDFPFSNKDVIVNSKNSDKSIVSYKSSEENPRRTPEKLIIEQHLNAANDHLDLENTDDNSKGNTNPAVNDDSEIKEDQNLAVKDITFVVECNNSNASEDSKKVLQESDETTNGNISTDLLNETFLMDTQLETISSNINNFDHSSSNIYNNVLTKNSSYIPDDIHNHVKFNLNKTFKTDSESKLLENSEEIIPDVKDKSTSDEIKFHLLNPMKSHRNPIESFSRENNCKALSADIDIFNSEVEADSKQDINFTASVNFSTASGRQVLVSSRSLRKIKNIFHEDHSEDCLKESNVQDQSLKSKNCEMVHHRDQNIALSNIKETECKNVNSYLLVEASDSVTSFNISNELLNCSANLKKGDAKNIIGDGMCKNIQIYAKSTSYNNCSPSAIEPDEIKTLKIMESFGFSTASGKHVGPSINALKEVKKLFCEESVKDNELFEDARNLGNTELPKSSEMSLSTPGHQYPSLSSRSFDKLDNIFSYIGSNLEQDINTFSVDTKIINKYPDLESINKKEDSVEDLLTTKGIENLKKFNTTISEFEVSCDLPTKNNLKREDNTLKSLLFSSASGKSVNVSTQSINKVKALFDNDPDLKEHHYSPEKIEKLISTTTPVSGKMSHSLNQVRHSDDTEMPPAEVISKSNVDCIMEIEHSLSTFNTASIRDDEVDTSSANMILVGNCNNLIDKTVDKSPYLKPGLPANEKPQCQLNKLHKSYNLGFTSGNGKFIDVTPETLSKVKHIFTDNIDFVLSQSYSEEGENVFEKSIQNHLNTKSHSEELSFTSAGGKAVSDSSKSRVNVNMDSSLSDDNIKDKENTMLESIDNIPKQKPSGETFPDINNLLQNIDTVPDCCNSFEDKKEKSLKLKVDHSLTKKISISKFGFTSGSGKVVDVSTKSLARVKKIFGDDIDTPSDSATEIIQAPMDSEDNNFMLKSSKHVSEFSFNSGSGKLVGISNKCLTNVNDTQSDIIKDKKEETLELKDNKLLSMQKHGSRFSFTSGSGKDVGVSTKSLAKVKQLFEDIDPPSDIIEDKKEEKLELKDNKLLSMQKHGSRFSFTSGSGKDVRVSTKSLARVKKMFEDIDPPSDIIEDKREEKLELKDNKLLSMRKHGSRFSFTSGSGKDGGVSTKSLARVKQMFEDIDPPSDIIEDKKEETLELKDNKLLSMRKHGSRFSFTSGSGKDVEVSTKSLARVKQMFEDIDPPSDIIEDKKEETLELKDDKLLSMQKHGSRFSFTSGSGKDVGVSTKSLARVKQLFEDIDPPSDIIEDKKEEKLELKDNKLLSMQKHGSRFSFTSGSGKDVGVSTKSLARVKQMFEDIDPPSNIIEDIKEETLELIDNKLLSMQKHGSRFSFTSGSGKDVGVSTKSLARVKQLFCDDDTSFDNTDKSYQREGKLEPKENQLLSKQGNVSKFCFTSGSGKSVSVSSKSLANVKNLFCDIDSPPDIIEDKKEAISELKDDKLLSTQKSVSRCSFPSGSGKDIGISSKSLAGVKQSFYDVEEKKVKLESKNDATFNEQEKIVDQSVSFNKVSGKCTSNNRELIAKKDKDNRYDNLIEPPNVMQTSDKKLTHFNITNGFRSAGGKSIGISRESFAKVSKLFEEDNGSTVNDQEGKLPQTFESFNFPIERNDRVQCVNFNEASYKNKINYDGNSAQDSPAICGFNTANGKSICVSESSLARVGNIFDDNNPSNILESCDTNVLVISKADELTSQPFSFNTGSGRSVAVNQESLNKVKQLFHENPSDTNTDGSEDRKQLMSNQNSFGFNTAGGKQVGISCESLSKVKALFNEVDDVDDCSKDKNDQILGIGYNSDARNLMKSLNENKKKTTNLFEESNPPSGNSLNSKYFEKKVRFKQDEGEVPEEIAETSTTNIESEDIFSSHHCLSTPTGPKNKRIRTLDLSGQSAESCKLKNTSAASLENSFEYFGSQIDFSLAHEISESTAAFLADDDCDWSVQSPTGSVVHESVSKLKRLDSSIPLLTSTPEIASNRICRKRLALNDSGFSPISKKLKSVIDQRVEAFRKWQQNALKRQEDIIKRKSGKEKPLKGIHLSTREKQKPNKINIVLKGEHPKTYTYQELIENGLDTNVIDVTSTNAVDFNFDLKETFLECEEESKGVTLDGLLVPNVDLKVGVAEITQCFLTLPGVDPSLVPENWVANHYRWIVWKLASYEKSFPHIFAKRCLTVENLLIQLQYRHDREITRAQRPAIRKILEHDESPFRCIALCIANITKLDLEHQIDGIYELELTDGWYSIWTTTDSEMTRLIQNSILKIGTKLVTCGAQLIGSDQPIDPLQDGARNGVRLKICTNSTRRAVWHCRLGFVAGAHCIPTSISKVLPHGGQISQLTATIARVYPMLHMSKDANGKNVFRSTKAESVEANSVDRIRIEKAEQLYQKVLEEVEAKYKPRSRAGTRLTRRSLKNISEITQPEVLYEMMEQSADPLYFQNQLSRDQVDILLDYRRQLVEKIQAEVRDTVKQRLEETVPQRKVTTILKVRLIDSTNGENAMLTLWRPADDLCSLMVENSVFCFNFITANGQRDKTLQLSSTRQTQYSRKEPTEGFHPFVRKLTCISEVDRPTFKPLFGEFDTVGFVIETRRTANGVNIVYLSDLEMNLLSITFWTSIKMFCKEDVFTSGSLIGACNVQWRLGSVSWQVPNSFATELSTFSNSPTQAHLMSLYNRYKQNFSSATDLKDFVEDCKNKLVRLLAKRGKPEHSQPSTPSPSVSAPVTRIAGEYRSGTPNSISIGTQQNHVNSPIISTPVQKRMKKLSSYGSPPPLTPLPINLAIPHCSVTKDFKSPFRISENVLQDSQPSSSQSSFSPPLSLE